MIFWDKIWSPICGHYFWNNHFGATKFCEQLGCYFGGEVFPMVYGISDLDYGKAPYYSVDAFKVGSCLKGDTWGKCTGGCNDMEVGGNCHQNTKALCTPRDPVRINITCSCKCTKPSSCTGNKLGIFVKVAIF